MLFSGYLACFSPSVAPAIRKLWGKANCRRGNNFDEYLLPVKNGGTLTHTDADFRKAQYFFCDGMKDPWLNELLSRSLIVRHASWVTLSVDEEFCMPIAAYTLDDGFDETKIRNLDPSLLSQGNIHSIRHIELVLPEVETKLDTTVNSRKRRVGYEDDSQRPKKKARIDGHHLAGSNTQVQPQPEVSVTPDAQPPKPDIPKAKETVTSNRVSFLSKSIHSGKVSNTRKVFESCLVYRKAPPTLKKPKKAAYPPLNPHTLFWNDLFAKCYARDGMTSLNLSIDDLLQAPKTKGVIFDVNKTHLGRRFINMDYA